MGKKQSKISPFLNFDFPAGNKDQMFDLTKDLTLKDSCPCKISTSIFPFLVVLSLLFANRVNFCFLEKLFFKIALIGCSSLNPMGLSEEQPIRAILKNSFSKKQKFTRFAKSKLSTTKNGKIEVEILQGQESFRVKSFVKSNIWSLLPAGKSKFKKGDILDCFFPNHSNQTLI